MTEPPRVAPSFSARLGRVGLRRYSFAAPGAGSALGAFVVLAHNSLTNYT